MALLDEVRRNGPGAATAERWLWLSHRRLLKVRDSIHPPRFGLGYAAMLSCGLKDMVMIEANHLARAICAARGASTN